jgi:transposase InsO family protein
MHVMSLPTSHLPRHWCVHARPLGDICASVHVKRVQRLSSIQRAKHPTGLLKNNGIAISMDGKGCWRDNVFVERLWKSVKYEEVYLHAYDSVSHARNSFKRYFEFYNAKRPHSSLDRMTPDQVYFNQPLPMPMAA